MKITKFQGRACLRTAQLVDRKRSTRGVSGYTIVALHEIGWMQGDGCWFDNDPVENDLDLHQFVLACCFAAAVAGVKP